MFLIVDVLSMMEYLSVAAAEVLTDIHSMSIAEHLAREYTEMINQEKQRQMLRLILGQGQLRRQTVTS